MRRVRSLVVPVLGAVVVAVVALLVRAGAPAVPARAGAGSAGSGSSGSHPAVAFGHVAVAITNYAFSPARLTVRAGTRVTWTNHDATAHTANRHGDGGALMALGERAAPRVVGAALLAVIAGVHFQQYVAFMSHVPTVGVLFLLNAAGGAGLALALLGRDRRVRALAALGGVGLAFGSLVCIVIALQSSLFGYSEPSLRAPIVVAIVAEALALPVLGALAAASARSAGPHAPGTATAT